MMAKLFIKDLPLSGKKVLMRVDFNVPLDNRLNVADPTKLIASLPSIRYVLEQGGSLILMSHLGRPRNVVDESFSLAPVSKALSALLDHKVMQAPNSIGDEVENRVNSLKPGNILLLENLRFHRAEEYPDEDPSFAKTLASYGDFYVNDAFGTSHRKHSSTYYVPLLFANKESGGFLLEKEINMLTEVLMHPKRPFYALIGGAKISSKAGILKSLLKKVDRLLIGGGMAYTFLKAQGISVGTSLMEPDLIPLASTILAENKDKILLPVDFMTAQVCSEDAPVKVFTSKEGIPERYGGLDIGPETIKLFCKELQKAQTILWNGPFGVYEFDRFAQGTRLVAQEIGNLKALSVGAGGDLLAALNAAGLSDKMTYLSTGGGATLEFIENGTLPGIEALSDAP